MLHRTVMNNAKHQRTAPIRLLLVRFKRFRNRLSSIVGQAGCNQRAVARRLALLVLSALHSLQQGQCFSDIRMIWAQHVALHLKRLNVHALGLIDFALIRE